MSSAADTRWPLQEAREDIFVFLNNKHSLKGRRKSSLDLINSSMPFKDTDELRHKQKHEWRGRVSFLIPK